MSVNCLLLYELADVFAYLNESSPVAIRGRIESGYVKHIGPVVGLGLLIADASLLRNNIPSVEVTVWDTSNAPLPKFKIGQFYEFSNMKIRQTNGEVEISCSNDVTPSFIGWSPLNPLELIKTPSKHIDKNEARAYVRDFSECHIRLLLQQSAVNIIDSKPAALDLTTQCTAKTTSVKTPPVKPSPPSAKTAQPVKPSPAIASSPSWSSQQSEFGDRITQTATTPPGFTLLRDLRVRGYSEVKVICQVVDIRSYNQIFSIKVTDYTENPEFRSLWLPSNFVSETLPTKLSLDVALFDGNLAYVLNTVTVGDVIVIERLVPRYDHNRLLECRARGDRKEVTKSFIRVLSKTSPAAMDLLKRRQMRIEESTQGSVRGTPEISDEEGDSVNKKRRMS
ncbi:hypothetical protein V1512DRAFT_257594 [Lipomyces arxii]|uniref:uncharacterized protein n=1 Tax=Lipomyces arxii TaxID=56418 RepID=UPI0034CFB85F